MKEKPYLSFLQFMQIRRRRANSGLGMFFAPQLYGVIQTQGKYGSAVKKKLDLLRT